MRATSWGPSGERLGPGTPPTQYLLDERDRIAWVGGHWDAFARENGAPELEGGAVIGASVFSFVADASTRAVYEELYRRVREGRSMAVPLRCDSPELLRQMTMVLEPGPAGYIHVKVLTMRAIPTTFVPFWLRTANRVSRTVVACGWCKRVRVGHEWYDPDVAVERMDLLEKDAVPKVSHGICPLCESELLKTLE